MNRKIWCYLGLMVFSVLCLFANNTNTKIDCLLITLGFGVDYLAEKIKENK